MIKRILNSQSKTVTFAAFLLAGFTLLSRLTGLLRNNLLGNIFPKGEVDIYLAAFRLPDFVYGIVIVGGISAAFLPVFSEYFAKSKQEAKRLVGSVFTVFLLILALVCLFLVIIAPQLVRFIVPGFNQAQQEATVRLMRLMFLSPIFLGASAIFSGILHYFNLFLVYALAPVLYNLGIIFGILFLSPSYGLEGPAIGVALGAFLHLLIQVFPAFKAGFLPTLDFNFKHPGLKKIFKLMLPRTIGAGAYHINLIFITAIASTLSAGAITVFSFSKDLYAVPMGLLGISFALAVFPALSRSFASQKKEDFTGHFYSAFSQIIFLTIPITLTMFIFRAHLVRLLYGTSLTSSNYFDWQLTRLTAASLGLLTISVFSACLIPLLSRVFYSMHDTKTPLKIALASIGLNIVLSLLFVQLFREPNVIKQWAAQFLKVNDLRELAVLGLPLALSLSTIFQFFLLLFWIKRRVGPLSLRKLSPSFLKIAFSSLVASFLGYLSLYFTASFLATDKKVSALFLQLVFACFVSFGSYLFFSFLLRCKELKAICSSLKAQFKK